MLMDISLQAHLLLRVKIFQVITENNRAPHQPTVGNMSPEHPTFTI
jgi:hypothetical protein